MNYSFNMHISILQKTLIPGVPVVEKQRKHVLYVYFSLSPTLNHMIHNFLCILNSETQCKHYFHALWPKAYTIILHNEKTILITLSIKTAAPYLPEVNIDRSISIMYDFSLYLG